MFLANYETVDGSRQTCYLLSVIYDLIRTHKMCILYFLALLHLPQYNVNLVTITRMFDMVSRSYVILFIIKASIICEKIK